MDDDKIIAMLEADLINKLDYVDITIISQANIKRCTVEYLLISRRTGTERRFNISREELVGLDGVHKAMKIYNRVIKEAQILLNEQYS